MPYTTGIDIGSRNTKVAVWDIQRQCMLLSDYCDTGVNPQNTVRKLFEFIMAKIPDYSNQNLALYATGYGRNIIESTKTLSEISCHARGCHYLLPECFTIIDIGGQDCKVISLDTMGKVSDFAMNDKCAAGTGRFLEMVALKLEVPCSELSGLAAKSILELSLSSTCVVFAESEIIGLIASHHNPEDIARAVNLSIAQRIVSQVNQLNWLPPIAFTGGVAFNEDLKRLLEQKLCCLIQTPPNPEITGALGAAILAAESL